MNDEILHKSFDKKVDGAESTEIYLDCLQGAQASLWNIHGDANNLFLIKKSYLAALVDWSNF